MPELLDAHVITRGGPTVHEEVGEQILRHSDEVWRRYAEKLKGNEESLEGQSLDLAAIIQISDYISELQRIPETWISITFSSTWDRAFSAISGALIEAGQGFRIFHERLESLFYNLSAIATFTGSETSSIIGSLQATYLEALARTASSEPFQESEWTDEKNKRRCELVDKEIEGNLDLAEQAELEKLQAEMLAYRRQIAPLPLDELRELHQKLLRADNSHRE